ncbi:MAG TPA: PQQ-binding-like beta-propeller repeat protein, partial [Bacteroidales bacterium]|nr:PQQ-binding-like beta-propeller repeat protein [Bacteroidales bacterium]
MRLLTSFLLLFISLSSGAQHYDWPMWRYDAGRTASTPEQLSDKLYLQWEVKYPERVTVWDDPLNQNLMQFDRVFEPIVVGDKIFIGFNDQDKVVALDINNGKEVWHFYADGPVRLPLAANMGKIYFTGDDGYCYCLDANTGKLVWKKLLAPAENKLLGNKRMISMWPARGGIVIKNNVIYTAASIFPLMGTFIYALDAETGHVIWENQGTSSNYILQPHKSPAFADVAPQGAFALTGNTLLVAGGRSVPAAFDSRTGEELYYMLAESGKTGGWFTCANDRIFFNHFRERETCMFESKTGKTLKQKAGEYPVLDRNMVYFSGKKISGSRLENDNALVTIWRSDFSASNELIKAGNCLYASDSTGIYAIKISGSRLEKTWSFATDKKVERLVAANGKLVAVASDGTIMTFGDSPLKKNLVVRSKQSRISPKSSLAEEIISKTGIKDGYAAVFGTDDVRLLESLIATTSLNVIAFEKDSSKITYLREHFDRAGITAGRMSFLHLLPGETLLPKYFASLMIVSDVSYLMNNDRTALTTLYESLRPYGGSMWIEAKGDNPRLIAEAFRGMNLHGAEVSQAGAYAFVTKTGALEGSDDWTHNYGDISNTIKSDDKIVKAPLGILWFGGASNLDVLPRHGHGPSEQVIDGKLVIEGVNTLSARDVYTGRLLWKRSFENLDSDAYMVFYDDSYDGNAPLDTKYNQEHLPGANARGTNFVVTREFVYLIEGNKCHVIDINTGEESKTFTSGNSNTVKLAYIGAYKNYLILGNNFTDFPQIDVAEGEKPVARNENYDVTASRELVVMDRFTGVRLWSIVSNLGFIHNSIIVGDDVLYCIDKYPQNLETRLRRRGAEIPKGSRLLYLDMSTGNKIHEETKDIFGTWLGYSSEYKLLLEANRPSRDMLNGESGKRMRVYKTGTKEVLWDKNVNYNNPPIIANDKIYSEGEGFYLLTGESLMEKDPVTGEDLKWKFKREYGCGYVIASEHLLTFRSASAGFVNLDYFEGTGSLGGFKAGCSANLIVANGVLNSPDYTRTCQCPYQNQTSLAFVNMPWMNYWTNSNYSWDGKRIRNIGINLNAPGDRTSSDNVLWIDFPNVGGGESGINIKMDTVKFFRIRKEPVSVSSGTTPWVSSSAVGGVRSIEIPLTKERKDTEMTYTVKLYFAELESKNPGDRVFNVYIQDSRVLENFDICAEAGKKD